MVLQQCLDYMSENCPKGIPGGFERTRRLAELYGNPQEECATIHVAGTNGKGSTCMMIATMLQEAGYRVGLFTSPHLERYEERIRINGKPIDAWIFSDILSDLITFAVPRLVQEGLGHPGEFELLTVAGWIYFAGKTDFVVSEVGLGGTLDPTNLISEPLVSVITSVSLDHCGILGNTVGEIAKEKAGILKPGCPFVVAPQAAEAEAAIRNVAESLGVDGIYLREENLRNPDLGMPGYYHRLNANTAMTTVELLREQGKVAITDTQIASGLKKAFWPGRMEFIPLEENRGILLDGAHNPDGIARLKQNLQLCYGNYRLVLFLSILDDKDSEDMLHTIVPMADRIIVTHPEHSSRAENWRQLQNRIQAVAPQCDCTMAEDLSSGLREAVNGLQPGELLCVTGSLYLLGDCRKYLKEMRILDWNA